MRIGDIKMIRDLFRRSMALLMCFSMAFAPLLRAEQLSLPSGDMVAPSVTQENYVDVIEDEQDYNITVTVKDEVGVKQVILYYRDVGEEAYKTITMQPVTDSDDYTATIKSDEISEPGIEYYIKAMDDAGNTLLHGYSFSPLSARTAGSEAFVSNGSGAVGDVAAKDSSIFSNKWFWIGVGVLVLAAAGGGGGGGGTAAGAGGDTATLTVSTPEPTP